MKALITLVLTSLLYHSPLNAAVVNYSVSGEITHNLIVNVLGGDAPPPAVSDAFTAFLGSNLQVDFSVEHDPILNPNTAVTAGEGIYLVTAIVVSIDGTEYATGNGSLNLFESDELLFTNADSYSINAELTATQTIGGLPIIVDSQSVFSVTQPAGTSTLLDGAGLPALLTGPVPADSSSLRMRFLDPVTGYYGDVWSNSAVTSFNSATAVPLPSSALLLAFALLSLTRFKR